MAHGIDLDHVALGVRAAQPYLDVLVGEWGGKVREGGTAVGFRAMQVTLGGMHVELLEPWEPEQNDFLLRFLDRHGEGPHHLTFKVPDLAAEVDRLRTLGQEPVQIDLANVWWKECFLMPQSAHGTVVQIAQSALDDPAAMASLAHLPDPWQRPWWQEPPAPAPEQVSLERVMLTSPEPGDAAAFFSDVLGGELTQGPDGYELSWPGGGRLAVRTGAGRGIDYLEIDRGPDRHLAGTRFVAAGD